MTECIRVLIADDHPIVRRGLRTLLGSEPDMALVAEASDGQQLVELASRVEHDVILVDLVMPGQDGISAIEGGVPIIENGKIIGTIGVSGGSAAQDGQCAKAGAAMIK